MDVTVTIHLASDFMTGDLETLKLVRFIVKVVNISSELLVSVVSHSFETKEMLLAKP